MTPSILNPVTLGMTGLEVSPVAFGTWQLGGEWGQFDEDEGRIRFQHADDYRDDQPRRDTASASAGTQQQLRAVQHSSCTRRDHHLYRTPRRPVTSAMSASSP